MNGIIKIDINNSITTDAAGIWGEQNQLNILLEECSEVIQAIAHYKRKRVTEHKIAEEIADVIVCLQSVILILDIEESVEDSMKFKINRLKSRIKTIKEET